MSSRIRSRTWLGLGLLALGVSGCTEGDSDFGGDAGGSAGMASATGGQVSGGGSANASGGSAGDGGRGKQIPASGGKQNGTGGADPVGGAQPSGGSGGSLQGKACTVGNPGDCGLEICVDRSDTCNPDYDADCAGFCTQRLREPICSGWGATQVCPADLECLSDIRGASGTDPWGICVGGSAKNGCADEASECPKGFSCLSESGDCTPVSVDCASRFLCEIVLKPCPAGYVHAQHDGCAGACVPIDKCGCSTDAECPENAVCDRTTHLCAAVQASDATQWTAARKCSLPFSAEADCERSATRFVFEDGACVQKQGCGDGGFFLLEECMAACEGRPSVQACPAGRTARQICTSCGSPGGCGATALVCAVPCTDNDDCASAESGLSCFEGACQVARCF
jgi:hypothetical protein